MGGFYGLEKAFVNDLGPFADCYRNKMVTGIRSRGNHDCISGSSFNDVNVTTGETVSSGMASFCCEFRGFSHHRVSAFLDTSPIAERRDLSFWQSQAAE